jgi:hypothetical protein
MGFTESTHPTLLAMIRAQLAENETPSKDDEEEIVAKLVEDILSYSPTPVASGSGRRLELD